MYPNPIVMHSGIWLHEIVKKLQTKGYQFRVVFSVPSPPFPFSLSKKWNSFSRQFPHHHEIDGVQIDFLRYLSSYKLIPHRHQGTAYMLAQKKKLYRIIESFSPDMLWAQPSLPNGWAAMKLSDKFKLPYVMAVHGSDINESVNMPGATLKLRQIYESAATVISISQRLNRAVEKIAPTSIRQLVHFGIDPEKFRIAVEIREQYSRQENHNKPLQILSVSNLIKSKGIQYNIQAIGKLIKKRMNIQYTIVGNGEYAGKLKELTAKLGLIDNIRFVGKLTHAEALNEMAKTDIFSLPSYQEGMGVVYLEAMNLGVPSIGIRGQGIEDVIDSGVNGLLIEPHTTDNLATAIEQLASDLKLRKSMGSLAQKHIQKNFLWETTCDKFTEIFQSVVSSNLTG